jgi:hypothetical protein
MAVHVLHEGCEITNGLDAWLGETGVSVCEDGKKAGTHESGTKLAEFDRRGCRVPSSHQIRQRSDLKAKSSPLQFIDPVLSRILIIRTSKIPCNTSDLRGCILAVIKQKEITKSV